MAAPNMETDPLFTLLTDALRAGPASPQWHDAIAALRQQGLEGADEHRLLIQARENLESGREFRAVRAGPGFTRKLMAEIEKEPDGQKKGIPTATIVAIVCGLVILGVLIVIGIRLLPSPPTTLEQIQKQVTELSTKESQFLEKLEASSFAGSIPTQWTHIGSLKLDAENGLKPSPQDLAEKKNLGGGVVWNNPVAGDKAFAVEVTVDAPVPSANILLEAFVATKNDFSTEKGTSSKDLVWQLNAQKQQVLLSGSFKTLLASPDFQHGDIVRLVVDQNVAIVEVVSRGKTTRLWAGAHELGTGSRYVGVRFLQTGPVDKPDLNVQQIKITTSPPG